MTKYGVLPDPIDANINEVPDVCPVCHHGIEPVYLAHHPSTPYGGVTDDAFQIVFTCPRGECGSVFIAYYGALHTIGHQYQYPPLEGCLPLTPKAPDVPKLVAAVSRRFVKVYTQAEAAHSYRLEEVAGGGYRKALEVLIKDFLIAKGIKEVETVKRMNLHSAIKEMPSEIVTNMAYFAKLLGNDETHYYREWADKDINDVKKYLAATMNALNLYLMHEEGKEEFGLPK